MTTDEKPCACGLGSCTEPWEPGCGLGNSEQHARISEQSSRNDIAIIRRSLRTPELQSAFQRVLDRYKSALHQLIELENQAAPQDERYERVGILYLDEKDEVQINAIPLGDMISATGPIGVYAISTPAVVAAKARNAYTVLLPSIERHLNSENPSLRASARKMKDYVDALQDQAEPPSHGVA